MLNDPLSAQRGLEQAARLRAAADVIDETSRRLDLRVESLHYEGPAARRFRGVMAERAERAQRASRRLHDLADRLTIPGA